MEREDILSRVVEVEKEIQKRLESEKVKVHEWLECVKKESEEEILLEEKAVRKSLECSLAEAAEQAEARADQIVHTARDSVKRIKGLSTEFLSRIVQKEISKILPG